MSISARRARPEVVGQRYGTADIAPTGANPAADRGAVGRQRVVAVGGILAALGAASCCVVPFALFTLGVSGAWIGNLTTLETYQTVFAAIAAACLSYGFYLVYRRPKIACAGGSYCASPSSSRLAKIGLW